ncbi:TauD/TfdA dioxygenase family protein [Parasphingopyxis marina]|uniref:TauD/TfdA family dioxygenase n=1 Tax=Parasphingopyxis marina TaxID=2761622 RepID=A0A842HVQ0_9SPHN|nr:TauD/TfdA family dioxygenase [Parasphingopyxis marina]MBC2777176.1 TauD/TfdA family dioxygenase [Parasphingopyxis marina]
MTYSVHSLHPLFAAELLGFDLNAPISEDDRALIENLMAEHAVLVLRDLEPNDEAHIRFAHTFGSMELPPKMYGEKPPPGAARITEGLYDISNIGVDGNLLPADDLRNRFNKGNERWHTDSSFNALPTKWSLLLAYVVPPTRGDTEYVDTRAVYDALPPEMQTKVDGLQAVHDLWGVRAKHEYGGGHVDEEMRRLMPPVTQPLVRASVNGRKTLYIGSHIDYLLGLDREESDALLAELMEFATRPEFIYTHKWRVGDLVIWDNRCTIHRGTGFDHMHDRRDLRRATINEDRGEDRASTDLIDAG